MMLWESDDEKLNAEADAFAKRVAKKYREIMDAQTPADLAERVQQELACVRQEEEWAKLVEERVMCLLWDKFGHRAYCVEEPLDRENSGLLQRNWRVE